MVNLTGPSKNKESFNHLLPEGHYDHQVIAAITLLVRQNDSVVHVQFVKATTKFGAHLVVTHDLGALPSAQFADALCHLAEDVTNAVDMAVTRSRQMAAGS